MTRISKRRTDFVQHVLDQPGRQKGAVLAAQRIVDPRRSKAADPIYRRLTTRTEGGEMPETDSVLPAAITMREEAEPSVDENYMSMRTCTHARSHKHMHALCT